MSVIVMQLELHQSMQSMPIATPIFGTTFVIKFLSDQRIEFSFHNAYLILELAPSTVIFWGK